MEHPALQICQLIRYARVSSHSTGVVAQNKMFHWPFQGGCLILVFDDSFCAVLTFVDADYNYKDRLK